MLVGSAASLRVPQVPLSPLSRPFIRRGESVGMLADSGAAAPPRWLPLTKAAEDPPSGRVLVAAAAIDQAFEVQRQLRDAGYRVVGPAGSAEEALRLVERSASHGPRIDCALIDLELASAVAAARRLVDERIPLVWLTGRDGALPPAQALAPVVRVPCDAEALLEAIDRVRRRRSYPVPPPQPAWPRVFPSL
jgi:CheY-like chemotaxis protein